MMELVKYQMQIYFKSSRFVMPFAAVMVFLYMMYTIQPVGIVDSFSVSCFAVFFIMAWVGLSVSSAEDQVSEQLQLLNLRSNFLYYLSKVVFLTVLGLIVSVICVVFPVVQNLLNSNHLFSRQLTLYDVLNAFILLNGYSFLGGALGSLFHPRVVRDRKLAMILTVLVSLLAVVKTSLVRETPILKAVTWILPPADRVAVLYTGTDAFRLTLTLLIFLTLFLYGSILSIVKSFVCHRRKF